MSLVRHVRYQVLVVHDTNLVVRIVVLVPSTSNCSTRLYAHYRYHMLYLGVINDATSQDLFIDSVSLYMYKYNEVIDSCSWKSGLLMVVLQCKLKVRTPD